MLICMIVIGVKSKQMMLAPVPTKRMASVRKEELLLGKEYWDTWNKGMRVKLCGERVYKL